MKKIRMLVLLIFLFFLGLSSSENKLVNEINQLFSQKNYNKALARIEKGLEKFKGNPILLRLKFYALVKLEKYDDALAHAEKNFKNQTQILGAKFYIFKIQEKYEEALKIALEKEKISKRKSPWDCFELIELYIKLNNKEKALDWLDEAINRGFISFTSLHEPNLALIQKEKRFEEAIAKIKDKIGIDKKAKDFTIKSLSGDMFTLSVQKGKVILIDFWATWCGPCREEIPNLKKYYQEFKNKGFEIIGISLDNNQEQLSNYLKKENLKWTISFSSKGWQDETAKLYGVNSIPSYWLVDKKGNLRYFGLRKEKLKKAIEKLLAE